jgi:hypothetical protein
MKKLITALFLALSFASFSQTTDENKTKVESDFFIGISVQSQSSFAINDKFSAAGLPELKTLAPEFTLGWNVFAEKYSGDIEFGFAYSKNDNAVAENRFMGFNTRLRAHYNFVNKEKVAFTGGLTFAVSSNELDVYNKNKTVDLNNLGTLDGNLIRLKNQMFYIGPSASVYLFKNKSSKIRLNLGYEFAFTNGKWKSDFAAVNNTVKENGNNRFVFGISLL